MHPYWPEHRNYWLWLKATLLSWFFIINEPLESLRHSRLFCQSHHRICFRLQLHRQRLVPALPQQLTSGSKTSCNRAEEHTSEHQSLLRIAFAVFFLKKKTY